MRPREHVVRCATIREAAPGSSSRSRSRWRRARASLRGAAGTGARRRRARGGDRRPGARRSFVRSPRTRPSAQRWICARPPLAERLTDAARVDEHRRPEAAEHLGGACGCRLEQRPRRTPANSSSRSSVGSRQQRSSPRTSAASRGSRACLQVVVERAASSVGSNVRTKSRSSASRARRPPGADLVEHDPDRVVGRREAVDRPAVPVAEDHRAPELLDARQAFVCLRAETDVAEADDPVEVLLLEVGEHRLQRPGRLPVDCPRIRPTRMRPQLSMHGGLLRRALS